MQPLCCNPSLKITTKVKAQQRKHVKRKNQLFWNSNTLSKVWESAREQVPTIPKEQAPNLNYFGGWKSYDEGSKITKLLTSGLVCVIWHEQKFKLFYSHPIVFMSCSLLGDREHALDLQSIAKLDWHNSFLISFDKLKKFCFNIWNILCGDKQTKTY
jgi:hypothetical protein